MFRNLIPVLAHRYRVIAPDYPAFGHSGTPDRREFSYSFARFAELIDGLLNQLGIERYALYVQDYGAPVGYRLALRHPSASRRSSYRTATPMRRDSSNSGIRSRPTGPTVPKRIAKPCVRD